MSTDQKVNTANSDEISLKELIEKAKEGWRYLLSK